MDQEFAARRFRTAAAHYLNGRTPYPERLIKRVLELARIRYADPVMDLGCGPGQLAAAFAPYVVRVVAVDPEPEMLRVGREAFGEVPNIEWREGRSSDLSPKYGRFGLVCMGRSFHWMDRADTLRRLDRMVTSGGAVALFSDQHPPVPENAWYRAYRDVIRRWGEESVGARTRSPDWVGHESVLLDSAFGVLEQVGVLERRAVTVEMLVDRALSMSSTSRARLGDAAEEMVAEIRGSLPGGPLVELVLSQAVLGFRAGAG